MARNFFDCHCRLCDDNSESFSHSHELLGVCFFATSFLPHTPLNISINIVFFCSWNFHIIYVPHVLKTVTASNESAISGHLLVYQVNVFVCVFVLPFANNLINLIYTFLHFDRNLFIFDKTTSSYFFKQSLKFCTSEYNGRKLLLIASYFNIFLFHWHIKWKRMSRIFEKGKLRIDRDGVRDGISSI